MKEDDVLICSLTVLSFSLDIKMWGELLSFLHSRLEPHIANEFNVAKFTIDDIRDIEWQPKALSHL